MTKLALAAFLYFLAWPALAANVVAIVDAPVLGTGGGAGSTVTARFSCRSFGQVRDSGGLPLTLTYATPIMCWATASTVGGVAVNETGWVPEVFFDWNWDDTSLGSVVRGGVTVDLGKSVGLVAAHAFKPTGYVLDLAVSDITLTVSAVVGGVRQSDTATLQVIVQDPDVEFGSNTTCYGDDADCRDDPGAQAWWINGGDGRTILSNILTACGTGKKRIKLKGGVTFSTGATNTGVGANSCLIESYGTGKAKLKFTASSGSNSAINANNAACAGYRLNDVTFAATGLNGIRLVTASVADTGCLALVDSNVSNTPGEEFRALMVNDPGPPQPNGVASEVYFIKFDYTKQADSGLPATFIYSNYVAFVGGEISGIDTAPNNNEHNIRLPQWKYVVIDGMLLKDQEAGRHLIALRQDCGTSAAVCNHSLSASVYAIARNELRADDAGTTAVQICTSGTGGNESTKCYDGDIVRNLSSISGASSVDQFFFFESGGTAFAENARVRFVQNAFDMTGIDTSTVNAGSNAAFRIANGNQFAFLGNVVYHDTCVNSQKLSNTPASTFTAKNNVAYESGACSYDMFPNQTESSDNRSVTADPFNFDGAEPGTFSAFDFGDLRLLTSSPLRNLGVLDPITTDVFGNTRPQGTATEPGVHEVN